MAHVQLQLGDHHLERKKKNYKTPNKAVQPGPKLIITTFKIQATCGANYGLLVD